MRPTTPSLNFLDPTTVTDDREPISTWPSPLPKVGDADCGHHEPGPPLPIDPGSWGRPPVGFNEPGALPARGSTEAPPPAPSAPPAPATAEAALIGPTSRARRRHYRALAEAAVAVTLLTGLAFVAPRGIADRVPAESSTVTHWTTSAVPVLTRLINDCIAVESDSAPASAVAPGTQRDDAARYGFDLAAAQGLPVPPDPGLAQVWRSMLSQLAAAAMDLETVPGANQDAVARTHLRFAAVITALLELQQAIRPAA